MPFGTIIKDMAYYKAAYKRQMAITRQLEAELTRVKEAAELDWTEFDNLVKDR